MRTATNVAQTLVRVTGLTQVTLGLFFWTGHALTLVPVHMLVGFTLVLSLWTLAFLAARAGVTPGLVAMAAVWGLLMPVFGLTQTRLLPGDFPWVIQVLHLLVGLAAIGQGEGLAARIKQIRRPALQTT